MLLNTKPGKETLKAGSSSTTLVSTSKIVKKFKKTHDNLPGVIFLTEVWFAKNKTHIRIIYANKAATAETGYTINDIESKGLNFLKSILPATEYREVLDLIKTLHAKKNENALEKKQFNIRKKNGETALAHVICNLLHPAIARKHGFIINNVTFLTHEIFADTKVKKFQNEQHFQSIKDSLNKSPDIVKKVFYFLAHGYTTKEIAPKILSSIGNVNKIRCELREKFGLTKNQLKQFAINVVLNVPEEWATLKTQ